VRILERGKTEFTVHEYIHGDEAVDAVTASSKIGVEPERLFKTLVTRGAKGAINVFCIPAAAELDLKKAAKAAGEKSVEMVHVAELFGLTGYIRGGCSPIGMKKPYPVVIDETAQLFDKICVSGGRIGIIVELSPIDLCTAVKAKFAPITRE